MTNEELHKHVQNFALLKGYTLNQVLTACGINKSYFNDLTRKNIKPSIPKFQIISEFLGIPLEALLYGESYDVDSEAKKLVDIYSKLDHKGKIRVQNTAYDELERVEHEAFVESPIVTRSKSQSSDNLPSETHQNKSIKRQKPEEKQAQ